MSFLSGSFLFALPLALVPVAVHLYRRRQRDLVPWGAMQFLQQAARQGRRWQRLEELLLLLARCAVVLALVLALSRPQLLGEWAGDAPSREVILVLDNSLSMSRRVDGQTPFGELRERAGVIIDQLRGSDRLQYLLAVGGPDWQTTQGLAADDATKTRVRSRIAEVQPTSGAADLLTCVQAAVDAGADETIRSRHIFVLTDMQAYGSRSDDDLGWRRIRQAAQAGKLPTHVHVVPCGTSEDPIHNVAVASIEASATQVGTGESVLFQADVRNFGDELSDSMTLEYLVDGEVQRTSPVPSLAKGETTSVSWTWSADAPGVHAITGRVAAHDQLAGDDHASVIVEVVDSLPILVVESPTSYGERIRQADLFASAIGYDRQTPHADWHSVYAPKFVSPDDLAGEAISEFRAVVVTDLTPLSLDVMEKLHRFVEQGGGLWVILGHRTDPESFNALWYDDGDGLSPLPVSGRVTHGDEATRHEMIHPPSTDHPALAALSDTNRLDIDKVRIASRLAFDRAVAPDDLSVLLQTGSGEPLAVEQYVGRGRVVIQGLPIDVDASNLPLTKAWVVMVNDWLDYLTQPAATLFNLQPGSRLELPASMIGSPAEAQLITPDGSEHILPVHDADSASRFHYANLRHPGLYRVRSPEADPDTNGIPFHVARDARESDLTLLDPPSRELLRDGAGLIFSETLIDEVPQAASAPQERPLWAPLLIGCLLLLASELLLATQAAGLRSKSGSELLIAEAKPSVSERPVAAPR